MLALVTYELLLLQLSPVEQREQKFNLEHLLLSESLKLTMAVLNIYIYNIPLWGKKKLCLSFQCALPLKLDLARRSTRQRQFPPFANLGYFSKRFFLKFWLMVFSLSQHEVHLEIRKSAKSVFRASLLRSSLSVH